MKRPTEKTPAVTLRDIDCAPVDAPPTDETFSRENFDKLLGELKQLRDTFSEVTNDKEELQDKFDQLKNRKTSNEILDELIRPYALATFIFMCAYCGFVALTIICALFGDRLPDSVLKVLVGSTAVTVIGLVGMVLTGIFVGARRKL